MKLQNTEDNFRIQAISGLVLSIESNKNYESQKELQKKISLYSIVNRIEHKQVKVYLILHKTFISSFCVNVLMSH